jgi:hypothetical protein
MTSPTGKSLRPLYRRESTAEKETVDAHLFARALSASGCQHRKRGPRPHALLATVVAASLPRHGRRHCRSDHSRICSGTSLRSRSTSSFGGINPTIARRFGHPMAGTPLTPALCPSLMKASTVGENLRSCQAVSTSEAEMPKRSAIGTMTSRFEISACSVKNARETSWQKAPASPSPFRARTSSAVSSAKREFTLCCGGSIGSPTS